MKSRIVLFSALVLLVIMVGCTRDQAREIAKQFDPCFPGKAATHVVQLDRVQIGAPDFNVSTFGNPLKIKISLKENGREIACSSDNIISGTRGERMLNQPLQWVVNFSPGANYQIYLEEQSIIAQAKYIAIPGTPRLDYWPVAANAGTIRFGQESYLHFVDRVAG